MDWYSKTCTVIASELVRTNDRKNSFHDSRKDKLATPIMLDRESGTTTNLKICKFEHPSTSEASKTSEGIALKVSSKIQVTKPINITECAKTKPNIVS